ncbi:MAG: hypothetical protein V5A57_01465 [Candidatus Paceibacterota bacterium]
MCESDEKKKELVPAHEAVKAMLKNTSYDCALIHFCNMTVFPSEELPGLIEAFEEENVKVPSSLVEQLKEARKNCIVKVYNLTEEEREKFGSEIKEMIKKRLKGSIKTPIQVNEVTLVEELPLSWPVKIDVTFEQLEERFFEPGEVANSLWSGIHHLVETSVNVSFLGLGRED